MSSITVTAPSIRRPAAATRLRLTARGRRVLLALAALPLAIGLAFAALSGGSAYAGGDEVTASFETVTVMPGDTLWSIAEDVAPGVDPREVVDALRQLNLLDGGVLMVGEELAIPAAYAG
ncbi:LysM peptidoglycan-binding domain-containing protein [Microbacterium sp. CIAB417]|uniref:LysM peptidoglycan-binding domain-containing protein n=1 Tax=Microbacterium sp. CIAB417 TaxID=2860287 RepID=UPI001FAB481F|nr:LysM peptidoglycan-binding domain-containing protein [Microbacterium sp. CIAB417]